MSQDNFLFNESILENIRIGNVHVSDEEVIEAAKRAGCHEAILKLEKGYDTIVGSGRFNELTLRRTWIPDTRPKLEHGWTLSELGYYDDER